MKNESTMNEAKWFKDLQRARSIRLPILESPRLSSELSESNGNDMLRSHLKMLG